MQVITGGFCGHGYKTQVKVDPLTQVRTCGDCGLMWPKAKDADTPRVVTCNTEAARKAVTQAA